MNLTQKTQKFWRGERTGWKPLELVWLGAATAVILGLSLYWRDSPVSLLAALTGVW